MIMRKWIVMFAFRRKIGSFLLIYGYAPVPILHRISIKITFNPNEHCPGRCILCTWIFDIIPNFVGFQHLGSRQKQIIAHSVLEHLETIFLTKYASAPTTATTSPGSNRNCENVLSFCKKKNVG